MGSAAAARAWIGVLFPLLLALLDECSILDGMSNPSNVLETSEAKAIPVTFEADKYTAAIDGIVALVPAHERLTLLGNCLRGLALRELRIGLNSGPMYRGMLRLGGASVTASLIKNLGACIRASEVEEEFSIPASTLHHWKNAGRAIAFRPPETADDFFPAVQFSARAVAPWAAAVITATGNGAAAVHFLAVPRKQLDGICFAEALRDGHAGTAEKIAETARKRARD